jgi:hypothetical protein
MLQLLRAAPARDPDHKAEISIRAGLDSGDGVLDDNGPCRLDPEKSCRHQEGIGRRFSRESFRFDGVALLLPKPPT